MLEYDYDDNSLFRIIQAFCGHKSSLVFNDLNILSVIKFLNNRKKIEKRTIPIFTLHFLDFSHSSVSFSPKLNSFLSGVTAYFRFLYLIFQPSKFVKLAINIAKY